jgi:2-polyprenyl-3-methyl-5-hydroxy-6-metoxy-1,4-benzoquinol methylase
LASNNYDESYFKRQYDFINSKDLQLPIDFKILMKFLYPKPEQKILDLGCGLGRLAYEISKTGCHVVGTDKSKFAIDFATRKFGNSNIEFMCLDALKIDFKELFHGVSCYHLLEHLDKWDATQVLSKVCDALKVNGVLVIGIPIEESSIIRRTIRFFATGSTIRDSTHLRSLSTEEIVDDMSKAGFEITDKYTYSYHPAIRSLDRIIPFIGQKITTNAIVRGIKLAW